MRETRFYDDAATKEEALEYYRQRAIQMVADGWCWDGGYFDHGWGVEVHFTRIKDPTLYVSVYVLAGETGKGHLSGWFSDRDADLKSGAMTFITSDPCGKMKRFLEAKGYPFRLVQPAYWEWPEYRAVETLYGDQRAERSRQFLMQHIDEGLYLLGRLGASEEAKRAFCLHPIVQEDEVLKTMGRNLLVSFGADPWSVALAMEYRHYANGHLRHHRVTEVSEIALSPLSDVGKMLMADKIQNRKDFRKYLRFRLSYGWELERYYMEWFERLKMSVYQVELITADLERHTAGNGFAAPSGV